MSQIPSPGAEPDEGPKPEQPATTAPGGQPRRWWRSRWLLIGVPIIVAVLIFGAGFWAGTASPGPSHHPYRYANSYHQQDANRYQHHNKAKNQTAPRQPQSASPTVSPSSTPSS